ncbi:Protein argonaute [Diplodia intermedia]|uniref:Protein argonaute n=1 Tax=Diplodia intermedia TaxID=856260 RepID=A0ABR3U214_9PEZI
MDKPAAYLPKPMAPPPTREMLPNKTSGAKTISMQFPSTISDPEGFRKRFTSLPAEVRNMIYDLVAYDIILPIHRALKTVTTTDPPLTVMANACHHNRTEFRARWRANIQGRFKKCILRSLSQGVRTEFISRFWMRAQLRFCTCDTTRSDGFETTWLQKSKAGNTFVHTYLETIQYNVHFKAFKDFDVAQLSELCEQLVWIRFNGNLIITGRRFDVKIAAHVIRLIADKYYDGLWIGSFPGSFSSKDSRPIYNYLVKCELYNTDSISTLAEAGQLIEPDDADMVCLPQTVDFSAQGYNRNSYDNITLDDQYRTEDAKKSSEYMAIQDACDFWEESEDESENEDLYDIGDLDDSETYYCVAPIVPANGTFFQDARVQEAVLQMLNIPNPQALKSAYVKAQDNWDRSMLNIPNPQAFKSA